MKLALKRDDIVLWVYYIVLLVIAVSFFFVINDPGRISIGLLLVLGAFLLTFITPKMPEVNAEARIARTYKLAIDTIVTGPDHFYPIYRIPPAGDVRRAISFACPPLVDCIIPGIFRELDPAGWESLALSHALDVRLTTTSFRDLFGIVGRGEVHVVIASAAAVDRAQFDDSQQLHKADHAPISVLPVLQQFNAYYLVAKRAPLIEYLEKSQFTKAATVARTTGASTSLSHELMSVAEGSFQRPVLAAMLKSSMVLVERGADLDAALIYYWDKIRLEGESFARAINFSGGENDSIETTFSKFQKTNTLSLYMGGLAQASYLINRCEIGDEFIIVASPNDIKFSNLNSFVCTREFATERANELIRLYGWWFDLMNRFRRGYLFGSKENRELLRALIFRGIAAENGSRVKLIPDDFGPRDMTKLFSFLEVQTSEAIGSFLFPNLYEALNIPRPHLIDKLRRNDAVIDVLRVGKVESRDPTASEGNSGKEIV